MFAAVTIRRAAIGFAAVAGLALIAGLPVAINLRLAPGLHSSSVHAGSRGAVVVTTPVRLSGAPNVVVQAGWVREADAALSNQDSNTPPAKIVAEGLVLRLATSAAVAESGGLEEHLPPILAQLAALEFQSLEIRRGTIAIANQGGGTETLSDVAAEITNNRKGAYTAKGSATYRGSSIAFDTSWSLPAERRAPLRVPVKATLKSTILNASIDGRLAVSDDLRLQGLADVAAGSLRHVARWFGIPVSNGAELQDVRIKGTLDWGAGMLTFSRASVGMDGNEGTGALALDTSKAVPSFDGTLAFETFDLSRYFARGPSLASLWSLGFAMGEDDAPSVLTRINADMRLSATKISVPHLQTGRGAVTVALTNGKLQADVAELELEGGSFGGQITADMSGPVPQYKLTGKLENVDPGRSLAGLLHRNPLQGRATISLDLAGSGQDMKGVLGSLSGKAGLSLSEAGGRLGLDLRALLYAAQRSSTKGWASAGKGQTALEVLDLRVNVVDGIVIADQLHAKSGGLAIVGNGRVSVAQQLLDVALQFNNPERAPSSAETLLVTGTWADLEFRAESTPKRAAAPLQ